MKTKKLIASLLIIALLTTFIPVVSKAANPTLSVVASDGTSTARANVGESVVAKINLTDLEPNQKFIGFNLSYDTEYLSVSRVRFNRNNITANPDDEDVTSGSSYQDESGNETGEITAYATDTTNNLATSMQPMAEITFTVKKEVPAAGTVVEITSAKYNENPNDSSKEDIPITSLSSLTIKTPIAMTGLEVTPSETQNIKPGGKISATAKKLPEGTTNTDAITWSSSNPSVATVSNGTVTGVASGTATITATCGSFSGSFDVVVSNHVESISLDKTEATIHKGNELKLNVTKNPTDADENIADTEWTSSDPSVATVSNGTVKAVAPGSTIITAVLGGKRATCDITVDNPLQSLSANTDNIALDKGETFNLVVTKNPGDTTDTGSITYSSADTSVATVGTNGAVTAVELGETTITASVTKADGTEVSVTVPVKVDAHIESITINEGDIDELKVGKTQALSVTFNPEKFSESKTITWTSSDESVATIDNGTVTAVAPGTATITATSANGKTDSITVKVPEVPAESVTITGAATRSVEKGTKEKLETKVTPEDTTDDVTVTWSSSNPDVVSVDNEGNIEAKAPGNATITATVGKLTDTVEYTVTVALESISLDKTNETLTIDGDNKPTTTINVTFNPSDTTDDVSGLAFESSNPSVATVNEDGVVTAVGPGTTVIKATVNGKEATCLVTVKVALKSVSINGDDPLELKKGQSSELSVTYNPENATDVPTPTWTSSNPNVATVDNNGKVTGTGEGEADITVDYGNGITASRNVNVTLVHADEVVFDNVIEEINKGDTKSAKASLNPKDAEDTITYESSNPEVATVDENGNVTGLKAGDVTITATSSNGKRATMDIKVVEKHLESIEPKAEKPSIEEGSSTKIDPGLNPSDVTDEVKVEYNSKDPSIATVDENGNVTEKKAGETEIEVTVTTYDDDGNELKSVKSTVKLSVTEKKVEPSNQGNNQSSVATGGAVGGAAAVQTAVAALTTSPHTGDMNVFGLIMLAIISLIGMVVSIKRKK